MFADESGMFLKRIEIQFGAATPMATKTFLSSSV
jgi:hypothetical protein